MSSFADCVLPYIYLISVSMISFFSLAGSTSRLKRGFPSRRYTPKYLSLKIPCPAYTILNISFLKFQSTFGASIPLDFERGFPIREMVEEKVDQRTDKELRNLRRSSTHFNPIIFPFFWSHSTVPLHFCRNHPILNERQRDIIYPLYSSIREVTCCINVSVPDRQYGILSWVYPGRANSLM